MNNAGATTGPVFELVSKKHGLHAKATLVDGAFVVLEGSTACDKWASAAQSQHSCSNLRADLQKSNVLILQGAVGVFMANHGFSSPSAAAAVVLGQPLNGQVVWHMLNNPMRTPTGKLLDPTV